MTYSEMIDRELARVIEEFGPTMDVEALRLAQKPGTASSF